MFKYIGRRVALGERECSIQRRHQKLIEESPSPALTDEIRRRMSEAAVKLRDAVNYVNAGTIEFLFQDANLFHGDKHRIQVEHAVTLKRSRHRSGQEQLRVAAAVDLRADRRFACRAATPSNFA